jgi:triphosphoribosyl-dephospho-CoA synthase
LDVSDAQAVYQAIRLAQPAGMGRVSDQDIRDEPTQPLQQIMEQAAERDSIAQQYATGYQAVFDEGVPALQRGLEFGRLESAIIYCHLCWMANHPDSLIARKAGPEEARAASEAARRVLEKNWPGPEGWSAMLELDAWLCATANRRNPGTSADLVTACLFIALRQGIILLPPPIPWPAALGATP